MLSLLLHAVLGSIHHAAFVLKQRLIGFHNLFLPAWYVVMAVTNVGNMTEDIEMGPLNTLEGSEEQEQEEETGEEDQDEEEVQERGQETEEEREVIFEVYFSIYLKTRGDFAMLWDRGWRELPWHQMLF